MTTPEQRAYRDRQDAVAEERRRQTSFYDLVRRIAAAPFEEGREEYLDPEEYPGPDPYDLWANK
jgi:hypothetical protein